MNIVITNVARLPYAADEEPGMPSYEVDGTLDGTKFKVVTSLEIDGRDGEHEVKVGPQSLVNDRDVNEAYFEALCENDEFNRLSEAAAVEYYA